MAIINYDQGDLVRVTGTFLTSANSAIDPSVVKLAFRADAIGTTTIYTYGSDAALVRSGTGIYYADLDTNESPGRYEWNFYSTGTGQAAENGEFYVRRVLTTPAPPSDPMTTLAATNVTWAHTGTGATTRSVRDRLREIYSIYDYGAAGTGLTDDSTALTNAATAVSTLTQGGDLHIPYGTFLISANVTIPADVNLVIHSGALLSIGSGITITMSGGQILAPSNVRIFSGSGTVVFTSLGFGSGFYDQTVYPQWWGAIYDGTTDCGPAVALAINSGARRILHTGGPMRIATSVTMTAQNFVFEGISRIYSDVRPGASDVSQGGGPNAMFICAHNTLNAIFRNLRFTDAGQSFSGRVFTAEEGGSGSQQAMFSVIFDSIWVSLSTSNSSARFFYGALNDCWIVNSEFENSNTHFELAGTGIAQNRWFNNSCVRNTGPFIQCTANSSSIGTVLGLQVTAQSSGILFKVTSGANWTFSHIHFEYVASAGVDGGFAELTGCTDLDLNHCYAAATSGDMTALLLDDCSGRITHATFEGCRPTTAQNGPIRIKDSADLILDDVTVQDDVATASGQLIFDTCTGYVRMIDCHFRRGALKILGMAGGASTFNLDITDCELINGEWSGSATVALIDLATSGRVTIKNSIVGEDSSTSNPVAKFRFTGTGLVVLEDNDYIGANAGSKRMFQASSTQEVSWGLRPTMGQDAASASTVNFIGTTSIGTVFNITGTTTINLISGFSWQLGTTLTLIFDSTAALAHNQAASGTNYGIFMSSLGTYQARSGSVAALTLTSTATGPIWRALCSLP